MSESHFAMPFRHECANGVEVNYGISTRLFVAMHILAVINASDPITCPTINTLMVKSAVEQADLLIKAMENTP